MSFFTEYFLGFGFKLTFFPLVSLKKNIQKQRKISKSGFKSALESCDQATNTSIREKTSKYTK